MSVSVGTPPPDAAIARYPQPNYEEDLKKAPEQGIFLSLNEEKTPKFIFDVKEKSVFSVLPVIFSNIKDEADYAGTVPCFASSVYTGMIFGVLATAVTMYQKKSLNSFRYGFLTFLGMSIFSWEACQLKKRRAIAQAMQTMYFIQAQMNAKQEKFLESLAQEQSKS